jgi:hypothetical protein
MYSTKPEGITLDILMEINLPQVRWKAAALLVHDHGGPKRDSRTARTGQAKTPSFA